MNTETTKRICPECYAKVHADHILTAPNPWLDGDTIHGCPECKSPVQFREVCDEPGCWNEASCGTPTPNGYRRICGQHTP